MCNQFQSKVMKSGLPWLPVFRLRRLLTSVLAVVLGFNAMFMMVSQTHASTVGDTEFVEVIDDETMVVNCAGIHCNLVVDAIIDASPFYIKANLEISLTIGVADFISSPLRKPPRPITV